MIKKLKNFDDYLNESEFGYTDSSNYEEDEENQDYGYESDEEEYDYESEEESDDYDYEDESDEEMYYDGNLYEAVLKMTAKDRKKAQDISQLMNALNKRDAYIQAKEKFITIFKKEAKAVVSELSLKPTVLKKMEKITLRDF